MVLEVLVVLDVLDILGGIEIVFGDNIGVWVVPYPFFISI